VTAEAEAPAELLGLSPYQERVLQVPLEWDLILLGGRGGGKSTASLAEIVRHVATYGAAARVLVLRQSFPGLIDTGSALRSILPVAFEGATYNAQAHLWRFPSGATVELGMLAAFSDFTRYQGRSFTLLVVDEAGEWPDLSLVDRMRSNLRGPVGIPLRVVLIANPGGPAHAELFRRYVAPAEPWSPFLDKRSGRTVVRCPSTFRDNPFIDREAYARSLASATAGDPELGRAWLDGDWTIARGAFFAGVIEEDAVALPPWAPEQWRELLDASARGDGRRRGEPGEHFLAYDHGSAAPAVALLCWQSDGRVVGDRALAPRSVVLLDEYASDDPDNLARGLGLIVPQLAERVRDLASSWGVDPAGVADDAIFARVGSAAGSIADEFAASGVHWRRAEKGERVAGWSLMRAMLAAAGSTDRPGLYVSRRCRYWWATVPTLPRDPRRPDDLDTRAPDHAADATRYALGTAGTAGGVADSYWIAGV